jgi:NSS family neurotransmitter:Na+ symporter
VLFFAAFTSAISMLEVCVAAVQESTGWTRKKTTGVLTGALLAVSLLPALSYSAAHLSIGGIRLLDLMDETVGTLGLYIAAVLLAVAFTWFVPRAAFESETGQATGLNRFIFFLCKYVIPGALLVIIGVHLVLETDIPGISFISGTQCIGSVLQLECFALFIGMLLALIILACKIRK